MTTHPLNAHPAARPLTVGAVWTLGVPLAAHRVMQSEIYRERWRVSTPQHLRMGGVGHLLLLVVMDTRWQARQAHRTGGLAFHLMHPAKSQQQQKTAHATWPWCRSLSTAKAVT